MEASRPGQEVGPIKCHSRRVYYRIDIGHTATQVSALVIIFFKNDFSNLRDKSCIKRKKKSLN